LRAGCCWLSLGGATAPFDADVQCHGLCLDVHVPHHHHCAAAIACLGGDNPVRRLAATEGGRATPTACGWSEKVVRLAQNMQFCQCTPLECSLKRPELAQILGQLGVFLTWRVSWIILWRSTVGRTGDLVDKRARCTVVIGLSSGASSMPFLGPRNGAMRPKIKFPRIVPNRLGCSWGSLQDRTHHSNPPFGSI
jgi:hypothetical protein